MHGGGLAAPLAHICQPGLPQYACLHPQTTVLKSRDKEGFWLLTLKGSKAPKAAHLHIKMTTYPLNKQLHVFSAKILSMATHTVWPVGASVSGGGSGMFACLHHPLCHAGLSKRRRSCVLTVPSTISAGLQAIYRYTFTLWKVKEST